MLKLNVLKVGILMAVLLSGGNAVLACNGNNAVGGPSAGVDVTSEPASTENKDS